MDDFDDFAAFDIERHTDNLNRKQRAQLVNSGERSTIDGLTDGERALLQRLRRLGYELTSTADYPRLIVRRGAA